MDSLRAIAALTVLLYHVGFWGRLQQTHAYGAALTSLGFGVAVFFVLSGFLLYRPFVNADLTGSPRPGIRIFLRRRIVRVVPAYWFALTALAIFPGLVGVFTDHWWRYYFFLQIYSSIPLIRITGLSVAWSLCIEVSFYLALPFFAWLTRRLTSRLAPERRVLVQLLVLGTLGAASLILGWGIHGADTPPLLLTFFDWFALGMGLALASVWARTREQTPSYARVVGRHPGWCWGAALAAYALLTALVASAPQHYLLSRSQAFEDHALRGAIAALLVLPAVFGDDAGGWPRRVLARGWLRWLGLISYGIFLWHLPLLIWLHGHGVHSVPLLLICTLAVTIACASVSYYAVERPLLRFKDPRGRRVGRGGPRGRRVGRGGPRSMRAGPRSRESPAA